MIKQFPLVSVVIPVKNEAGILKRCLGSLKRMDYPPERLEIIVADGMSGDDSKAVALSCGARVVTNERELVVSGRNRGFESAKGDLVAFTDADCVFDAKWIGNSLKYFDDENVGGVGGLTLPPEDSSSFEKAIDCIFSMAEFFHSTAHRKKTEGVKEAEDIPGCNAIYRREALDKAMPVKEGLLTAEDVWMNFCIRQAGYKLVFAPDVILWHYRRNSPGKFLRQIYRFAIGRAQIGRENRRLLNIFHIMAGFAVPAMIIAGAYFYFMGRMELFIKGMALFIFMIIPLLSFLKTRSPKVAFSASLAMSIFILGWSAGFLREVFFPMKDTKGR